MPEGSGSVGARSLTRLLVYKAHHVKHSLDDDLREEQHDGGGHQNHHRDERDARLAPIEDTHELLGKTKVATLSMMV